MAEGDALPRHTLALTFVLFFSQNDILKIFPVQGLCLN